MIVSLIFVGLATGFVSGFFGIGGGTLLIPALLYLGLDMRQAVGISVTQMMFSSIFGSYLNFKKEIFEAARGLALGMGGFFGALCSGFIVSVLDEKVLMIMFLFFVLFALFRFYSSPLVQTEERVEVGKIWLFLIGFFVGAVAISVGIGGALLVTPVLVGFFRYDIRRAVAKSLFFVVFSSVAGFLSLSYFGHINYFYGLIVGISSLAGVYFGIKIAHKIDAKRFKKLLGLMYAIILLLILNKLYGFWEING
ncbi:sulfite exporter TauE/SafE family protein [Nitrosophilus alvini]|uniref:sulfite exporter TauE/SafE family protein n=1 Tax=Nitrosophilus alvini TaxID=2714855 RepID=UPI001909F1E7|nr:sulfite exporter TauE/SafE family protein [Nitrosophilus alvini]